MNRKLTGLVIASVLAVSPLAATSDPAHAATTTKVSSGKKILNKGAKYRGIRYKWGGASPSKGFDCSGFTQYTLGKLGKKIPRTAQGQYNKSKKVKYPKAGDLFFVRDSQGRVFHVGIYVNGKKWLEAERPGRGVNYYKPWSKSIKYGRYTVK